MTKESIKELENRVLVRVSPAMGQLRSMQGIFNGFWQTSDLAYGYALSKLNVYSGDIETPTKEVLGDIKSEVWVKNSKGLEKSTQPIGSTINQIRNNMAQVYRATMSGFFSAFESYLNVRVGYIKKPNDRWGPFTRTLSHPVLKHGEYGLTLRAIVLADICRHIRNMYVHEPQSMEIEPGDAFWDDFAKHQVRRWAAGNWSEEEIQDALSHAKSKFFSTAKNKAKLAREGGKNISIDYFFMLFSFTNLSDLAFEIEEALYVTQLVDEIRIPQDKGKIRRNDLIVLN